MIKKDHLKIFLVLILIVLLSPTTQSQTRKYFVITGKIISASEIFDASSIQISKNNKSPLEFPIPSNGRFRLELDYNSDYTLTFVQKGFLPKAILVNTNIPDEVLNRPTNFPNFQLAVKLYKAEEDAKNLIPVDQKQQIYYSPDSDNFSRKSTIYDKKYVDNGIPENNTVSLGMENMMKSLGN